MSNLVYPDWRFADLAVEPVEGTEVMEYETGHTQRNAIWAAPRARFTMKYNLLSEAEYRQLYNFWLQHRGAYEPFWFQDYTEINPAGKMIAVGDGTTWEFKMPVDWMTAATVYRNGVVDPLAIVTLASGVLTYAAAPPAGAVLTFDATNARYRVRFETDAMPYDRHKFTAWGGSVVLIQVKPYG